MSRFSGTLVLAIFGIVCILTKIQNGAGYKCEPSRVRRQADETLLEPGWEPGVSQADSVSRKMIQLAKIASTSKSTDEYLSRIKEEFIDGSILDFPGYHTRKANDGTQLEDTYIDERSSTKSAQMVQCTPQPQIISLEDEIKWHKIYFPPCLKVNRCPNCCSRWKLGCEPLTSRNRTFVVMVTTVPSEGDPVTVETVIPIEEHTECAVRCRTKEEDCKSKQCYNESLCTCECINKDEEAKCLKDGELKIWNQDNCTCTCREEKECSSNFYFDQNTCSCKPKMFTIRSPSRPIYGQNPMYHNVPPVIGSDLRRKPKENP